MLYIDCCIRGGQSRNAALARIYWRLADEAIFEVERLTLMDDPLIPFQNGFFWQREHCGAGH